jgi:thioredoxin 1
MNLKEMLESDKVRVVKFGANWCGPCKLLDPILDEFSSEVDQSRVEILRINIENDEGLALAKECNVAAVPTTLFILDGQIKEFITGVIKKKDLLNTLSKYIKGEQSL